MTDQKAEGSSAAPFDFTVEEPEQWQRVIKVQITPSHFEAEYARRTPWLAAG